VLRFDETGEADHLTELLEKAQRQPLTPEEATRLAEALNQHQPWLEWATPLQHRAAGVMSIICRTILHCGFWIIWILGIRTKFQVIPKVIHSFPQVIHRKIHD
jgi:hypothetical protein